MYSIYIYIAIPTPRIARAILALKTSNDRTGIPSAGYAIPAPEPLVKTYDWHVSKKIQ